MESEAHGWEDADPGPGVVPSRSSDLRTGAKRWLSNSPWGNRNQPEPQVSSTLSYRSLPISQAATTKVRERMAHFFSPSDLRLLIECKQLWFASMPLPHTICLSKINMLLWPKGKGKEISRLHSPANVAKLLSQDPLPNCAMICLFCTIFTLISKQIH